MPVNSSRPGCAARGLDSGLTTNNAAALAYLTFMPAVIFLSESAIPY